MMTADNNVLETNDLETFLTKQKEKFASQIIAQGSDEEARKRIRTFLAKLNETEAALQAIAYRYVSCPRQIDAIMQYLQDTHRAQTKAQIVQGVLRGKFRGGGQEQARGVQTAVEVFISPDATGTKGEKSPLRMRNGLIGLKQWPDEMFEASEG